MTDGRVPRGTTMASAIPWPMIRHEYQTTFISFRKLAAKYGLRSSTTIRRRLAKEGWQRDVCALIGLLTPLSQRPSIQPPPLAARGPEPSFPWKNIRKAYETQPFSVRQLAVRFGVSESRIRFRRDREGWTPAWEIIAARQLTRLGQTTGDAFTVSATKVARKAAGHEDTPVRGVHPAQGAEPAKASFSSFSVRRSVVGDTSHAHTVTAETMREEHRAAHTRRLLEVIENARSVRHQGMATLRLARCVLTYPDAQQRREAAQRLSRTAGGSRRGMVSILWAAMDLVTSGIRIENQTLDLLDEPWPVGDEAKEKRRA